MSHGQKGLKTAILDHFFFGLKEGKTACSRIFFQHWKGSAYSRVYPKHFSLLLY